MIISPPFLPDRHAKESEAAWLFRAMAPTGSRLSSTRAPEGGFPLSNALAWHNGIHIQAEPAITGGALPVRAIADGEVVFVHTPDPVKTDPNDPLNYDPFGGKQALWSDTGCLIIRHTTDIGEGANATNLSYYSVYMHLSKLGQTTPPQQPAARDWAVGDRIWRKDEVGQPGSVYGHTGQIHFEICMDQGNLRKMLGREPAWIDRNAPPTPQTDGRIDAVFGSLYIYLPAETPTLPAGSGASAPRAHVRPVAGTKPLGTAQWVRISYEQGSGKVCALDLQGQPIGAEVSEADFEYDMYTQAVKRHQSLTSAQQTTSSPSGWYELLRFGRNLGRGAAPTDKDPLPPDAAHWRTIPTPTGTVWADLNAPNTYKFSDADFPSIAGWNIYDDDTEPGDQRCDSIRLKEAVCDPDTANTQRMQTEQLALRLGDAAVQALLGRAICKFPSEWDKDTIEQRYGFVKKLKPFQDSTEAWPRLQAHLKALCFDKLPQGYKDAIWHVHPREFIAVMRHCGWLSPKEFAQCIPRSSPSGNVVWDTAYQRAQIHAPAYNKFIRIFSSGGMYRYLHNLAQSLIETGLFRTLTEDGKGAGKIYGAHYGRGYHQLTWAGNYEKFSIFKNFPSHRGPYADNRITATSKHPLDSNGTLIQWSPRYDPVVIEKDLNQAGAASGFYWVSKHFRGRSNINRICDSGVSPNEVGFISWLVNGGGYGYKNRQHFARYIANILLDELPQNGAGKFNFPSISSSLIGKYPIRPGIPQNNSGSVNYVRQIP